MAMISVIVVLIYVSREAKDGIYNRPFRGVLPLKRTYGSPPSRRWNNGIAGPSSPAILLVPYLARYRGCEERVHTASLNTYRGSEGIGRLALN